MTSQAPYRERLAVPWWAWPAALVAAAAVSTELAIGAFALRNPITYAVTGLLALIGVAALGRVRVSVADGELHVDDAHIPLSMIGEVTVIDLAQKRDLLGQDADPLAFVVTRPWIRGGVRIDLVDPEDPTPYWYVGSRRPQDLAEALATARTRVS